MAVPKKKTSKSRRDMRRSHLALGKVNVSENKVNGEFGRSHHISIDGTYNGRQVLVKRSAGAEDKE